MKKYLSILLVLVVTLTMLAAQCAAPPATPVPATPVPATPAPAAQATAAEEPATEPPKEEAAAEPVTITWITIAGFYTDWAEEVTKEWEEATGNNVEFVDVDLPTMYERTVLEAVGHTGAFDIVTWDVTWKGEWAYNGYLLPLDEYIAESDPNELQIEDISPILEQTTSVFQSHVYGFPYYTFTMGYFYRCDLFEDPTEKEAFQAKYGYELDIPTTYEQMADIAEFFRRNPGDTLKGEVLDKDFYGIGLMASRDTNMQDELNSIVWTWGGDLINDDGTPATTSEIYLKAADLYVNKLLVHAPPAALTSSYDEVVSQMRQGLIAQTGPFFLDQWPNMVKTEDEVPGAEVCPAPSPGGGRAFVGALTLGVSADSKNPDVAWDFLKFITGPEAQRKFAEGGGSTCRLSILTDEELVKANRETMGHFPPLVAVLDHAQQCFYSNYYILAQGGKIYEEEAVWNSAMASGELPVEEAMKGKADAITEICGGPCTVIPGDWKKPPADCPFTFDKSVLLRKP
jgi:multiple sugar transport system substrate-binding protein